MTQTFAFQLTSLLAAPPAVVWQQVGTMAGVNRELFPLARMTYPSHQARIAPDVVPIGQRWFRSWILLFGLLPIDYDDLLLAEVYAGGGFLERSSMLSMREWQHQRVLHPLQNGCRLVDTIHFVTRVSLAGPFLHGLFLLVFRLRHHNLRRMFGVLRVD